MPSRKVAEQREKWQSRINIADNILHTVLHSQWRQTLENYRGLYFTGARPNDVSLPVNVVQSLAGVLVPSVYFRDPAIRLRATIPNTDLLVSFHEAWLNYSIRRTRLKRQMWRSILDAYLFGVAHLKIGWETVVEKAYDPATDPETGEPLKDTAGNPLLLDDAGNVFVEETSGRVRMLIEQDGHGAPPGRDYPMLNEYVEREKPYAIRWSPWDFLKDPSSLMLDNSDAEWICYRSSVPVEEVRENPYYENNKEVEPTHEPSYIRSLRNRERFREGIRDNVTLYELYCKKYDRSTNSYRMYMKVFAEGHDEFLFNDVSPLATRGFPGVSWGFLLNPESGDPLSPVEILRPQIDAINVARTQAANHRERFHHKYLYKKNRGITERDAKRFARGGIGSVLGVKLDDDNADVRKAFQAAETPPLPPELWQEIENYWNDIRRVDGTPPTHLGGSDVARQATQASYIEGAIGVRMSMKQDIIADAVLEAMSKWTDLARQYADNKWTTKVLGSDGAEQWQTMIVSEAIPDDFDSMADMHLSSYQGSQNTKAELREFLNLVANLPGINLQPIITRLAREYGFPTPEMIYTQPQPQPVAPGQQQPRPVGSLSENAIDSSSANRALNTRINTSKQVAGSIG